MKKLTLTLLLCLTPLSATAQALDAPRPIPALETVWMDEMTWMEVRDAIASGKTTAIVATGGIEQNGPYAVNGKHAFIVRSDAEAIAKRLGDALVAPVVPFAPEDYVEGAGDYRNFPGTFHLRTEIFQEVLKDICLALKRHGFRDIALIGDNLPNQEAMAEVADELNAEWAGEAARVHHIPEYYAQHGVIDRDLPNWGVNQESEGVHSSYRVEATLMAINPDYVRLDQRIATGKTTINSVSIVPAIRTIEHGNRMQEIKTIATVRAIRQRIRDPRPAP